MREGTSHGEGAEGTSHREEAECASHGEGAELCLKGFLGSFSLLNYKNVLSFKNMNLKH